MAPDVIGIVGLLVVVGVGGMALEAWSAARDRLRFPAPGKLIAVNGHALHVLVNGERQPGRPVVVLEAGLASW